MHFQNAHAFRGERIVWIIIDAVPAFIMVQLWGYLEHVGRMTSDQAARLSVYYLLVLIISRLTATNYEEWFIRDIKDGAISKIFVKPIKFPVFLLAGEIMWRITGILYILPVFALFGVKSEYFRVLKLEPLILLFVFAALIIAFIIRFLISWMISLAAFWLDEASFLTHLKWGFEGFLGGLFLPLTFFPATIQKISAMSPFYLWYQVPIGLISGTMQIQQSAWSLLFGCGWVIALSLLSVLMWNSAVKKYSAVGG